MYTGSLTAVPIADGLTQNANRKFLRVVAGEDLTVNLVDGTSFTLVDGEVFQPAVFVPVNAMTFTGADVPALGEIVVNTGGE